MRRLRRSSSALREHLRHRRKSETFHGIWDDTSPNVVVTGDGISFDADILAHLKEEGFGVLYLPFTGNVKDYSRQLQGLEDSLESGYRYAIVGTRLVSFALASMDYTHRTPCLLTVAVMCGLTLYKKAYGEAAALVLDACLKPMPKLNAVVAYYPTHLPSDDFSQPHNIKVHLVESIRPTNEGATYYRYEHSHQGFAERHSGAYDPVSARVAWSRTIACLREGFDIHCDLESKWEEHLHSTLTAKDVDKTMGTIADGAHVCCVPTLTGGFGHEELRKFYEESFIPKNPPSLDIKLVSRTMGTDHVVDEMYLSFRHTQEVPWMLPGIPPTDKPVEVAIVSVVAFRGGKICHENIYWDQASVLVQLGLLDPKYIPPSFKAAMQQPTSDALAVLPIAGTESARCVLQE